MFVYRQENLNTMEISIKAPDFWRKCFIFAMNYKKRIQF